MINGSHPFDTQATDYDQWFDSAGGQLLFNLELAALQTALGDMDGRWLEVGVGSGQFAAALGIEVGVDPSSAMLKIAAERGIATHLGLAEQLPLAAESFDGVVIVCALCFFGDPRQALRECRRVLKPGGRLVLGFIPRNSAWGHFHTIRGQQGHSYYSAARFYRREDVQSMADEAGLEFHSAVNCPLPSPEGVMLLEDGEWDESFMVLSFVVRDGDD